MPGNERAKVRMTEAEVLAFLEQERTTTMCTMHPDGSIHAVAMWYALLDGQIAIETRLKSQKMSNVRRDPRVTFLVDAGLRYQELRGVQIAGRAMVLDDEDARFRVGVSIWERYKGPYLPSDRDQVDALMRSRVVVVPVVEKVVSWDHRKLAAAPESA